jgi:L-asparaginase
MRPATAISADGPINLYNAVILAGSKDAIGKGVLVCLNDEINAGREVTKTNTSTADTFRTPDLGMLGYMQDNKPHFCRESTRPNTTDTEFDVSGLDSLPKVDIAYGNYNSIALDAFVKAGAKGIVHAGEQPDDKYDWVVSDDLNPQKARILLMLALTEDQ